MTRDRRYRFREDDLAIIKKVAPRVDSSLQALFMLAGAGLFYKGVCLGHQAICQAFGGKIVHAKHLMHGKTSQVKIVSKSNLFKGIKSGFTAARYHSLTADPDSLPSELKVTDRVLTIKKLWPWRIATSQFMGCSFTLNQ